MSPPSHTKLRLCIKLKDIAMSCQHSRSRHVCIVYNTTEAHTHSGHDAVKHCRMYKVISQAQRLYFWYHRSLLLLVWLLLLPCDGNLILHHQRVDDNAKEAEPCEEPGYDDQAVRPAENIGVPVRHPRAIKSDHHSEHGNGRGDTCTYTHIQLYTASASQKASRHV